MKRCSWAQDPLMVEYHDKEWGVPVHDDAALFEMLTLEGAQAGLSWSTILKRRQTYRDAFDNFDPFKVSEYTQKDVKRLLADKGIIRNRLKVQSTISNAKQFLKIQQEFSSFDRYIWGFVDGIPIRNNFKTHSQIPSSTILSDKISKDLQKRGFSFVGTTICYAFMQAVGMVNDHTVDCFRRK
ncbi:DNA-3-methyladenine glycosylase I [Candidatus Nitrosotenuis cloacae]|uniref:DNA-3-methyladenine glycosylase I n=1 Tax=Candidatus Nitrosotenuis cloacae TaxID=1603555 RepID=UPI002280205F|nr:DNA-3-methyladenine glycosylase I [Candidatus Nitrosotenuis cloacae]